MMHDAYKDLTQHTKMHTNEHASCDRGHVVMRTFESCDHSIYYTIDSIKIRIMDV